MQSGGLAYGKENIADDASGILVEGVLESMAEYYSVELSQKIHRGMAINAEKCLSNGSNPGLGFKVDAERRFYVDEEEAAIVREIYERYASGETKAEIIRDLKRRRVKTSLGKEFSPNSLSHLLSNKRMAEKAELEAQLAIEKNKKITLTEAQILAFLDYVCEMPADDVNKRRAIINIFVHSIYLHDDHFTLIINASKKPLSIDNIPLDDIETAFEGETGASEGCSSLSTPAPPKS